jgi:hypothetical protein
MPLNQLDDSDEVQYIEQADFLIDNEEISFGITHINYQAISDTIFGTATWLISNDTLALTETIGDSTYTLILLRWSL